MKTLEVWWSPTAECYRIEDGEMFTYYDINSLLWHFLDRNAIALVVPPPHDERTAALVRALRQLGIPIQYSEA